MFCTNNQPQKENERTLQPFLFKKYLVLHAGIAIFAKHTIQPNVSVKTYFEQFLRLLFGSFSIL